MIELADYITNPPPNFTLQINWNRGIIPTGKFFKVMITQKVGKMIKVDAYGVDKVDDNFVDSPGRCYQGLWLPEAGMKKLEELR